jgi:hypothetical protein
MAKRNLKLTPSAFIGTEGRDEYLAAKTALQKAQDVYDTTPAGIAELVRRAAYQMEGKSKKEYQLRLERGQALRAAMLVAVKTKDGGDIKHTNVAPKLKYKNRSFLPHETLRETVKNDSPEILTMIKESKHWVNQLTTEETEAMAWFTSNGSSEVNQHLANSATGYSRYSKEHLDATTKNMDSALAKFQRDEPVIVYRGISMDIVEARGYKRNEENFVAEAFPMGGTYSSEAYMSTSLDPSRATGFASSGIVLEIKSKKAAPVANISAWDITEKEMVIPRNQKYKIVGIIKNPKIQNLRSTDNTVIQLEEI